MLAALDPPVQVDLLQVVPPEAAVSGTITLQAQLCAMAKMKYAATATLCAMDQKNQHQEVMMQPVKQ